MAAPQALLREWELLQRDIVPSLLATDAPGPPRSLSIGPIEDAVALAVAFGHAAGPHPDEMMEVYTQPEGEAPRELGVSRADVRQVPARSRQTLLTRHDSRWLADECIAEHILLADPTSPVDLVTVRCFEPSPEQLGRDGIGAVIGEAVDHLDEGGQLLVIGPPTIPVDLPETFSPVISTAAGRVYRNRVRPGRCARTGSRSASRGPTLAHRRRRDELVSTHLRLAGSLARKFAHRGENADDLEQVAMLALIKAAGRFDPDQNVQFSTFATSSIVGELKRHFRDKAWIMRVPRPMQETYLAIKAARDDLTQSLGAVPTPAQLAEFLELSESATRNALEAGDNYWPASLDGDRWDAPIDVPVTDRAFDAVLDRLQLNSLIPFLDDRERLVVRRVYFESRTQSDVASELGLSQMQVSRVLARALAKLKG